jgi:hypothetical protein
MIGSVGSMYSSAVIAVQQVVTIGIVKIKPLTEGTGCASGVWGLAHDEHG